MIVPSVTVSPSCGIVMSANVETPSGEGEHRLAEGLGKRRVRLDELTRSRRAWLPSSPTGTPARAARSPTGPTMWTPSSRPARPSGSFSQMTFTRPSVSPRMRARPLPPKGSRLRDDLEAGVQGALLGHAHERHLRMAVDAPGHLAVVDRNGRLAEDLLHHEDRLGKTDVSQLRRRRRDRRPRTRPRPSCASTRRRVRGPARRARRRSRRREARRRAGAGRPTITIVWTSSFSPSPKFTAVWSPFGSWPFTTTPVRTVDPAPGERPYDDVGHIRVAAREDLRQRLEQGDLDTEIDQHRGELAADRAAADHRRRLRKLAERRAPRPRSGRSGRPTSNPGRVRGTDPDASTTCLAPSRRHGSLG